MRGRGEWGGWLLLAALLLAYALSFVDRQILALLIADIRHDLHLTDGQIGVLQGPAFGLVYALFGLPCGWLADRTHRLRVIGIGLLLWTGATIASGLATGFGGLVVARMGVGIGEAALVPAAVSLIADRFGPARRALPLALFTAGVSVGAGLALILGGALIGFARSGAAGLPLIGGWLAARSAWQAVLILAGGAGVPLALLFLLLREPRRLVPAPVAAGPGGLAAYLCQHRGLFVRLYGGAALLYVFANALAAWLPTLFVRGFGWTPMMVGARVGVLVLASALIGNISGGMWAGAMARARRPDASLRVMAAGAAALLPAALLASLAGRAVIAQAGVALTYGALSLCFGVATASLVAITPVALRGRVVALYLLLGNLAGLGLGPPAVGALLDHGVPIGRALALVAGPTILAGALLLWSARPRFAVRAASIED